MFSRYNRPKSWALLMAESMCSGTNRKPIISPGAIFLHKENLNLSISVDNYESTSYGLKDSQRQADLF